MISPAKLSRSFLSLLLLISLLVATVIKAQAFEIQEVTSKKGIKAWLVEDYTVPIIAMNFAWKGGAAQDPENKQGLGYLLSTMLDEGAGELKSKAFQTREEELTMSMGFSVGKDSFSGSLRTLAANKEQSFAMLSLALTQPRFDSEALERMRSTLIASYRQSVKKPGYQAALAMNKAVYGKHPYALPLRGTEETLKRIGADDLKAYLKNVIARDNMYIGVVGAISPQELSKLLDKTFADLPAKANLKTIPEVKAKAGQHIFVKMDIPQTTVMMSVPSYKRQTKEYVPAEVMNHILGGGTFSSWLFEEVREKRGLTYSVGSYQLPRDHSAVWNAFTSTRTAQTKTAIKVMLEQINRMANQGPSTEELQKAKDYMIGSYPLSFDSSAAIASQLLGIQMVGFDRSYVTTRNDNIAKVSLAQVNAVAKDLFANTKPTIVAVGAQNPFKEEAQKQ
ncbi:M16 family metallopeptidase [Polycladidibacter stylochi]|uniref:M16 family metallopeptidase n=1 Tax=Polycladidibacter stylochi TaxID=1807766 RepID=UPI00082E9223|nr:pitrilysin family protein [Pseudovibrio stylochi]